MQVDLRNPHMSLNDPTLFFFEFRLRTKNKFTDVLNSIGFSKAGTESETSVHLFLVRRRNSKKNREGSFTDMVKGNAHCAAEHLLHQNMG